MEADASQTWIEWYHAPEEIERLVTAFLARTLPLRDWTHSAHLTVGLWHLLHYDPAEARLRVRFGIQSYNEAQGVAMTPEGGYHETITLFYLWAIGQFLKQADPGSSLVSLTNGLLNGPQANKKYPLEYYSPSRLFGWNARVGWVEPDLKPLEGVFGCTPAPF